MVSTAPHPPPAGDPSARRERWILPGLVLGMVVSLVWLVTPHFDFLWDSTLYVLSTRSLLAGEGYAIHGDPFTLRPPGFSLILLPVMATFGTNFLAFNLLTSALGILAVALAYVWFRPRLGATIALGLCVLLWLNPQMQRICNATLSDTAGLAALFGCLLLDRRARRRPGLGPELLLGLGVGVAIQLRTVAVLLLPALALSRMLGRREERTSLLRLGVVFVAAVAVQVPWSLWKRNHPLPEYAESHVIQSYWTAQWHADAFDADSPLLTPGQLLERVPLRVEQSVTALGSGIPNVDLHGLVGRAEIERGRDEASRTFGPWLGGAGILALLVVAARRRRSDDLFALANLALLAIYFDFDERLLVPVFPIVLAAGAELVHGGVQRFLSPTSSARLVGATLALTGVLDHAVSERRFPLERINHLYERTADYIDQEHPDATVGALPGHEFAVFLERSVYLLEVALVTRSLRGVVEVLRRRDVDLVVFVDQTNVEVSRVMEPILEATGRKVAQMGYVQLFELEDL